MPLSVICYRYRYLLSLLSDLIAYLLALSAYLILSASFVLPCWKPKHGGNEGDYS